MSLVARHPRHASPSAVLTTALLSAIFAFAVTAVSLPGDVLGASVTKSALCATNLRTSPSASAPSKVSIPAGTRVAVVVGVAGTAWHATCAGRSLSGSVWYRISAINAKSVQSLYGVTYLYAASGLFKPAPFVRYVACTVNLRTGPSKYRPIRATLRLDARVIVATTVSGTAWRTTCGGKAFTGQRLVPDHQHQRQDREPVRRDLPVRGVRAVPRPPRPRQRRSPRPRRPKPTAAPQAHPHRHRGRRPPRPRAPDTSPTTAPRPRPPPRARRPSRRRPRRRAPSST